MIKIIYLLLVIVAYAMPIEHLDFKLYALTVLLIFFNFIELRIVYKTEASYFLISPVFLSCVVTFGLVFGGIANFLLLSKDGYFIKAMVTYIPNEREWLVKAMFIACIASLCTWLGYYSRIGTSWYEKITSIPIYRKLYQSPVSENRLIFLAVLAYLIKVYLFTIGLYGRILDERFYEAGLGFKAGSQIRILNYLSYVTFFIISIYKFRHNNARFNFMFFGSLALELFFGFLFGARSAFIFPLLIVFIAYYYVKQKFRIRYLVLILLSTYFAFTIVLEYKNYSLSRQFTRSGSAIEVMQSFINQRERVVQSDNSTYDFGQALDRTIASTTFLPETALAIRQRDKIGMSGLGNPNILLTILSFPIDAFVPRFIQGENEFQWGLWFKDEVMHLHRGLKYSIAMSPIGYLYMGGGLVLVILGFLLYGVLLRFAFFFLLNGNIYSMLVFLLLLDSLYNLDSIYSNSLVYMTRNIFIYPIIFWLLFDPKFFSYWKN